MEYLPRIHHIGVLHQSPRVTVEIERNTRKIHKTKKIAGQVLNSFLSVRRDLEQDNGHSSELDQRRSGTLLVKIVHKENGIELQSKLC